MKKVEFISRIDGVDGEFIDEAYVSDEGGDLETDIKNALNEFNEEEDRRYGKKARQRFFVRLIGGTGTLVHQWHKVNLSGIKDTAGIHDVWSCSQCKLTRHIHFLDGVPSGGNCFPERTCAICNRVFKSIENFKKHKESKSHLVAEKRGE